MSLQLPEPVRSTMQALTGGLLVILGDRLLGVYLGGSIALGDFCEASSDLDFLVVTRGVLSPEDLLAVDLLHRDLLRSYPYAHRLEGDYAPVEYLVPEGTIAPVPGCERGVFLPKVGEVMLSADNIYNMREHGIAIYGPSPQVLLPPVSREQVRAAVRAMLAERTGMRETPQEAAAELLNLLRSAVAMESGEPATKSQGVQWGLTRLAPEWQPVIRAAQAIRWGSSTPDQDALVMEALPRLTAALCGAYARTEGTA